MPSKKDPNPAATPRPSTSSESTPSPTTEASAKRSTRRRRDFLGADLQDRSHEDLSADRSEPADSDEGRVLQGFAGIALIAGGVFGIAWPLTRTDFSDFHKIPVVLIPFVALVQGDALGLASAVLGLIGVSLGISLVKRSLDPNAIPYAMPFSSPRAPVTPPIANSWLQDRAESLNREGCELVGLGDLVGAVKKYTEAIKIAPTYAEPFYNRGKARLNLDQNPLAFDDFTEAIRLQPDADAFNNRGIARRKLGDPIGAIRDYDMAILLNPGLFSVLLNRGIAHYETGDREAACRDFSVAAEHGVPEASMALQQAGCRE